MSDNSPVKNTVQRHGASSIQLVYNVSDGLKGIFEYPNRYLNIPPILKYSADNSGFFGHPSIFLHGSF